VSLYDLKLLLLNLKRRILKAFAFKESNISHVMSPSREKLDDLVLNIYPVLQEKMMRLDFPSPVLVLRCLKEERRNYLAH